MERRDDEKERNGDGLKRRNQRRRERIYGGTEAAGSPCLLQSALMNGGGRMRCLSLYGSEERKGAPSEAVEATEERRERRCHGIHILPGTVIGNLLQLVDLDCSFQLGTNLKAQ